MRLITDFTLRFGVASRPVTVYAYDTVFDEKGAAKPDAVRAIKQDLQARRDVSFEFSVESREKWRQSNDAIRALMLALDKELYPLAGKVGTFRDVTFPASARAEKTLRNG